MEPKPMWCPDRATFPGLFALPFWPTDHKMAVTMVLIATCVVQTILGVYVLRPNWLDRCLPLVDRLPTGPMTDMRRYIGFYVLITMSFSLAFVFELNYFVIYLASIHNWFEWQILGVAYFGLDREGIRNGCCFNRRHFNVWSLVFIFGMVQVAGMNWPNMIIGHSVVQITGLWTDGQLALTSVYKLMTDKDRSLWAKFTLGAIAHVTMIGALFFMIAGFVPKYPVGTTTIMMCLYPGCFGYTIFALNYDAKKASAKKADGDQDTEIKVVGGERNGTSDVSDALEAATDASETVPRFWMIVIMTISLIVSAITVFMTTIVLPKCAEVAVNDDNLVWLSYAVQNADGFSDMHQKLLEMKADAADEADNKFFRIFEGRAGNDDHTELDTAGFTKFVVYECWTSEVSAEAFQERHESFYYQSSTVARTYEMMDPDGDKVDMPATLELKADYDATTISVDNVCQSKYPVGMMTMTLNPFGWQSVFESVFIGVAEETRKSDYNIFYMPMMAYHPNVEHEHIRDYAVIEAYEGLSYYGFQDHFLTMEVTEFSLLMARTLQARSYHGPLKEIDMFSYC